MMTMVDYGQISEWFESMFCREEKCTLSSTLLLIEIYLKSQTFVGPTSLFNEHPMIFFNFQLILAQ